FQPGGVPGHVEVEEVAAVGLQVDPFPGGVRRQQDAQRVLARVGVERPLDLLASGWWCRTVVDLDALLGAVGSLDGGFDLLAQVAQRIFVLGKDQQARAGPFWRAAGRDCRARLWQPGTRVLPN